MSERVDVVLVNVVGASASVEGGGVVVVFGRLDLVRVASESSVSWDRLLGIVVRSRIGEVEFGMRL